MNPLFLHQSNPGQMKLWLISDLKTQTDGLVLITATRDQAKLNRIEFSIYPINENKCILKHVLDYNQRTGFDPTSSESLDTQDTTVPYISPESYGLTAEYYQAYLVIPKSYMGNYVGSQYRYEVIAEDLWGQKTKLCW